MGGRMARKGREMKRKGKNAEQKCPICGGVLDELTCLSCGVEIESIRVDPSNPDYLLVRIANGKRGKQ